MDTFTETLNLDDISELCDWVDEAQHVVLTGHMSPDGDAVGSTMGLANILLEMGKDVTVIYPDAPPENLRFLTRPIDFIDYVRTPDFADKMIAKADLIFCLDYNGLKRIDRMAPAIEAATARKVMIDHHIDPEHFCDITISEPEISSTCQLLFYVICAMELVEAIDEAAANCLLAGMMTDTGNFSFNNSNDPEIYRIVAFLMECGAQRTSLVKKLFDTCSADCLRLNAYALCNKLELWEDKGAALITLTRDELNAYNYKRGYTEGLVNKPLAIPSIKYVVYLREESRYIKVSMRSKGQFPCNIICEEHFNGGGHLNAAGGEFEGTMQEAIDTMKSLLDENYHKYIEEEEKHETKIKPIIDIPKLRL